MESNTSAFSEQEILNQLSHYLPAQAPLKDFIHHNTLHAFQREKFHYALRRAAKIFGYKTLLSVDEYRSIYSSGKISDQIIERVIAQKHGVSQVQTWKTRMLQKRYDHTWRARIGKLRAVWKKKFDIDIDLTVHPSLFRLICGYLDQGISINRFPVYAGSLLASVRELEKMSKYSLFRTKRARQLLLDTGTTITSLLDILVGDPQLYTQYLFDQQFAHQGWSGIVCAVEQHPETLSDPKPVSLHDFVLLELLFEIDSLDRKFGEIWSPLCHKAGKQRDLFAPVQGTELSEVLQLWQNCFEWSYYSPVLSALSAAGRKSNDRAAKTFQALFCIDDRELSLRDYIEKLDPDCETYATPGFFSVEFYFVPNGGKTLLKQCPAPVTPRFIITENGSAVKRKKEIYFTKHSHSLLTGWLLAQTLGLWSMVRLVVSLFRPSLTAAAASSFTHMNPKGKLKIERQPGETGGELLPGFTTDEMTERMYTLLMSIGLNKDFAPFVYLIGHGASSMNNPHYAAYNCGACCGKPGSVNARVAAHMLNHPAVRENLRAKGIDIPADVRFIGGLHDTTRDELFFYDDEDLKNDTNFKKNISVMRDALRLNAKERARRFELLDSKQPIRAIHRKMINRSVSLFEPRPELNHATNALCVVGRRSLTRGVFLDRRAFANSYDYRLDPAGDLLMGIIRPLGPVCGGINLEYFFSRVDNHKLGAGTKLPHNVMGLIGVANGIDGDLRPGLPSQMTELHDPMRLMLVIEHLPEVVLQVVKREAPVYEWFINEWVHLAVIDPKGAIYIFSEGELLPFNNVSGVQTTAFNKLMKQIESEKDNLPVQLVVDEHER
jgi:uncharacterized protein